MEEIVQSLCLSKIVFDGNIDFAFDYFCSLVFLFLRKEIYDLPELSLKSPPIEVMLA